MTYSYYYSCDCSSIMALFLPALLENLRQILNAPNRVLADTSVIVYQKDKQLNSFIGDVV